MGKKKPVVPPARSSGGLSSPPERISSLGFRLIGAGAACVVAGFVLLWFSDPSGRNWASHLSPFFILGGYGLVGLGLMTPEKTV